MTTTKDDTRAEDGDPHVLRDGDRVRVSMMMLDDVQRVAANLAALDGGGCMNRPGFRYDEAPPPIVVDHAPVDAAYEAHDQYLANAWRGEAA